MFLTPPAGLEPATSHDKPDGKAVAPQFAYANMRSLSASGVRLIVDITELEQQKKKITQTQA